MDFDSLGELLLALRKDRKLSQKDVYQNICDPRIYIRWEKNLCIPTSHSLNLLSSRLNYDLNAYYKLLTCDKTAIAADYIEKTNKCINEMDWHSLYKYIQEMHDLPDFKDGENKMNLLYCQAIYHYAFTNDYTSAMDYCIDGLKIENPKFKLTTPINRITSNVELCLLNCISNVLFVKEDYNTAIIIYSSIIENIECKIIPALKYYQSIDFEKQFYQLATHNLTLIYKKQQKIPLSLEYIDKGIDFSIKQNYIGRLGDLYELKFEVLYLLEDYENSRHAYDSCLVFYYETKKLEDYNRCKEYLTSKYPNLANITL